MKYINTYADLAAYTADTANRGTTKSLVSKINDGTGLKYEGKNIVMPKEFAGVGDTVVFDTIDNLVKVIKVDTCVVATKPANLIIVGVVYYRTEDKVYLVGLNEGTGAYKTENTATPLTDYDAIRRINGVETNYCGGNLPRFIEFYTANGSEATGLASEPVAPIKASVFNNTNNPFLFTKYGTYSNYMASNMLKYPYSKLAIIDDDGKSNTAIIMNEAGAAALYPAFNYCATYSVSSVTGFTAGNWWLPSMKELYLLIRDVTYGLSGITNATADALNRGLYTSGGTTVNIISYYWSSTEYSASGAWCYYDGGGMYGNGKSTASGVRAVSAFQL